MVWYTTRHSPTYEQSVWNPSLALSASYKAKFFEKIASFYVVLSPRKHHATQSSKQGRQEGRLQGKDPAYWGQEEEKEEEGILLYLHLQSAEAGAPRHWNLQQGHVYHELFRE